MMMVMMIVTGTVMMIRAGHPRCRALESDVLTCDWLAAMHGERVRVCEFASMIGECMSGGRAAKGGCARIGCGASSAHSSATEMAAAPAMAAATRAAAGVTASAAAGCGGCGTS
jgi:hypothetical protein